MPCYKYSSRHVVSAIASQFKNRYLRPRYNDRFTKILQHKGQRRGSIRHGICTMKDDEAVILSIKPEDVICHLDPVINVEIAGVFQFFIFVDPVAHTSDSFCCAKTENTSLEKISAEKLLPCAFSFFNRKYYVHST